MKDRSKVRPTANHSNGNTRTPVTAHPDRVVMLVHDIIEERLEGERERVRSALTQPQDRAPPMAGIEEALDRIVALLEAQAQQQAQAMTLLAHSIKRLGQRKPRTIRISH